MRAKTGIVKYTEIYECGRLVPSYQAFPAFPFISFRIINAYHDNDNVSVELTFLHFCPIHAAQRKDIA